MRFSVGVIAHNEEKNIGKLLDVVIGARATEVFMVSSSTDGTNRIAASRGATVIREDDRQGKAAAVNRFLASARSHTLVLLSADVLPQEGAIDALLKPLEDPKVGIVGCRPVPFPARGLLASVVTFQWKLHHAISKSSPKFGEMMGFRKVFERLPDTAVDEECIAMLVKQKGYSARYAPDAVVRNRGPANCLDFVRQRRRIYCGHLQLARNGYRPASLGNFRVLMKAFSLLRLSNLHVFACALVLEGLSRLLGLLDYLRRKDHTVWKMVER